MPPTSSENQDSKQETNQPLIKFEEQNTMNKTMRSCIITIKHPTTTAINTINTTITYSRKIAENWLKRTLKYGHNHFDQGRFVIGLGVEWLCPSTIGGHRHPAATIQLFSGSKCLIFLLRHSTKPPYILRQLLQHPRITFVGLWCNRDAEQLLFSHHRLKMFQGMPIDLRQHNLDGKGASFVKKSIPEIAMEVLGLEIEWSLETGMSDWEDNLENLNEDQIKQASIDAFLAFTIGLRIEAWNLNPFSHLNGYEIKLN